jgi:predicted DCC family thiol-disulfide oxidoreductase YuxK
MEDNPRRFRVLIDGGCGLCNGFAGFVRARDHEGRFEFLPGDNPSTVVLVEDGREYTRSAAVLRILARLPFPWPALGAAAGVIPTPVRDALYNVIARHRRNLVCRIP